MKFPIGIQSFERIIEGGFVYVDKTAMIYDLTHESNIYFLSRPRRFGKSLLVSTLENYYLGRRELFKGLAIEKLETEWNVHPVFHVDFNGANFTREGVLETMLEDYVDKWEEQYGLQTNPELEVGLRFRDILGAVHEQTGRRAVVLIDEYDKPILDVLDTDSGLEDRHRDVLKGFYSVFKVADSHLQFVLLTGVTKFSKFSQVSVFSGFNQPKDISMDARYETLCGITQEELESYFPEQIAGMALEYDCSPGEMRKMLKQKYDGYHFSKRMTDIYNPFSVLNALDSRDLRNFWFSSGTPTYLIRLLTERADGKILPTGGVHRLQGGCGAAASDDLPERLPDHQGLRHAPEPLPAGFPEQRGEGWFPDGPYYLLSATEEACGGVGRRRGGCPGGRCDGYPVHVIHFIPGKYSLYDASQGG